MGGVVAPARNDKTHRLIKWVVVGGGIYTSIFYYYVMEYSMFGPNYYRYTYGRAFYRRATANNGAAVIKHKLGFVRSTMRIKYCCVFLTAS